MDIERDGSGGRYIEVEADKWQMLNLVRDLDVLVTFDFLAVYHEADRYGVPEFCCELSAFHCVYLLILLCLAAELQLTHGWRKSKLKFSFCARMLEE